MNTIEWAKGFEAGLQYAAKRDKLGEDLREWAAGLRPVDAEYESAVAEAWKKVEEELAEFKTELFGSNTDPVAVEREAIAKLADELEATYEIHDHEDPEAKAKGGYACETKMFSEVIRAMISVKAKAEWRCCTCGRLPVEHKESDLCYGESIGGIAGDYKYLEVRLRESP